MPVSPLPGPVPERSTEAGPPPHSGPDGCAGAAQGRRRRSSRSREAPDTALTLPRQAPQPPLPAGQPPPSPSRPSPPTGGREGAPVAAYAPRQVAADSLPPGGGRRRGGAAGAAWLGIGVGAAPAGKHRPLRLADPQPTERSPGRGGVRHAPTPLHCVAAGAAGRRPRPGSRSAPPTVTAGAGAPRGQRCGSPRRQRPRPLRFVRRTVRHPTFRRLPRSTVSSDRRPSRTPSMARRRWQRPSPVGSCRSASFVPRPPTRSLSGP